MTQRTVTEAPRPQIGACLIVTSSRQRNDGKPHSGKPFYGRGKPGRERSDTPGTDLLWGWHAVVAALANPGREVRRLMATPDRAAKLTERFGNAITIELSDNDAISRVTPPGAVHQGILLKAAALEGVSLEEMGSPAKGVILMLDQVTDPQNVGAIFRSAAAFGVRGVVIQERHAPSLSGALAKAAAGAVDALPHARVVNLSRALETLAELGWRAVGLDGSADLALGDALDGSPTVLVLGSEGEGLRRLVSEHCDALASIPMPGGFESLNVSAAAAVALYEASRPRSKA
jgi:23S rRNA (guanosine2251-2'-O)-methyltransferase